MPWVSAEVKRRLWRGQHMAMARRRAIWPGLCLTIVVYGINMFGDALRDLLDPRLRGSV